MKKIISIDPSVNNSGICIFDIKQNKIQSLDSKRLWDLFQLIKDADLTTTLFMVENSNLVKGNWHGNTARGNVGKNKGISQNIVDFLKEINAKFIELKPRGYSLAYKNSKDFKELTGCDINSNKDNRAAAAMILNNRMLITIELNN